MRHCAIGLLIFGTTAIRAAIAQPLPVPRVVGGDRLLTLDDVYGVRNAIDLEGDLPAIVGWMPDGAHYLLYDDNGGEQRLSQLMVVEARAGGLRAPLYDGKRLQAALAAALDVGANVARSLAFRRNYVLNDARTEGILAYRNDLYCLHFAEGTVTRLTDSPVATKRSVSFSPDGRRVAFVRDGTALAVADNGPGPQPHETILTHPGPKTLDGRPDWLYEEEVYDRRGGHPGYAWSGDSRRIAFLRLDESPVKPYAISNDMPRVPESEAQSYPLAGDPNPIATLGIADADGHAPPRFVDLKAYPEPDRLIVRLNWSPDSSRVVYQVQNRTQTYLDLVDADAATGQKTATLLHETTPAWVDITGQPVWLRDGGFLWLSDRSGHRQVYRYGPDGHLVGAVTPATGDVRTVYGVDAANRWAYLSAGMSPGGAGDVVCRVALDGKSGGKSDGKSALPSLSPVSLSLPGGTHHPFFDPTFGRYLDTWSDRATPPRIDLYAADTGASIAPIAQNPAPLRALAPFRLSIPEPLTVPARDGVGLHALLIRPPDFDPKRRYPVFCPIYGGPGIPNVLDNWMGSDDLFYQMLAQQGYVVFLCDNRSAGGSPVDAWPVRRKLGEAELRDLEDGVTYLKTQPWVAPDRIGLSGWSYGGTLVEYALTHSHSFKMGIAGAGVADWRLYDTIYTERYMDTPLANPDGYRASSPTESAAQCSGRLLLLHGMMDDNVHLPNTIGLTFALERAGIDFDLMLYPGPSSRHGIGDPRLNRHLEGVIYDFIRRNL